MKAIFTATMNNRPDIIVVSPTPVTKEVTQITVTMRNFELNAAEGFAVVVRYDKDNRFIDTKEVPIPADIYASWGTDDSFIINYVLGKLAMTQIGIKKRIAPTADPGTSHTTPGTSTVSTGHTAPSTSTVSTGHTAPSTSGHKA